jgi:hypothetical protein
VKENPLFVAAALAPLLTLSACAAEMAGADHGPSRPAGGQAAEERALHFPRQAGDGIYMQAAFSGRLSLHAGCLVLGNPPGNTLVWNRDARLGSDGRSVTDGRTGRTVRVGDRIRLGGGLVAIDQWGRANLAEPFPSHCPKEVVVVGESFEKVED